MCIRGNGDETSKHMCHSIGALATHHEDRHTRPDGCCAETVDWLVNRDTKVRRCMCFASCVSESVLVSFPHMRCDVKSLVFSLSCYINWCALLICLSDMLHVTACVAMPECSMLG